MKPVRISHNYAHFDDGTGWPLPSHGGDEEDDVSLEWALRYGQPTRVQILEAAGIISAYEALVRLPQRRRSEVVRAILAAAKTNTAAGRARGEGE